ncbi:MAG: KUP/HAK/KT family potassium transporter, partial [Chitinophagaceae bacterium]
MNTQMMKKISTISLIVTFGIIYGDIGTSPLYTMNAIVTNKEVTQGLVLGALSCIIWTLTLQTTVKYVILTLNADNNGEGGIFSLFALIHRKRPKWLIYPAIIGGVALLADGMITAPISITSAVEGLRQVVFFKGIQTSHIVITVILILSILFIAQQFGTKKIGTMFGPIMFLWLTMLAFLGIYHLSDDWTIIKAFNPYYGIKLLID